MAKLLRCEECQPGTQATFPCTAKGAAAMEIHQVRVHGAAARPLPVQSTRWKCPFCGRSHAGKRDAQLHIVRCTRNPAVRACQTCRNYTPGSGRSCAEGIAIDGRTRSGCALWAALAPAGAS